MVEIGHSRRSLPQTMGLLSTLHAIAAPARRFCAALPLLAQEPVAGLRGRRLDAADFDRLAIGDPVRDLLKWMSDAKMFEEHSDAGRWATFREICARDFGFDPETLMASAWLLTRSLRAEVSGTRSGNGFAMRQSSIPAFPSLCAHRGREISWV